MKTHIVNLEDYFSTDDSGIALIPLNDFLVTGGDVKLDIWNSDGEGAVLDIKEADQQEIVINQCEIKSYNFINLKFVAKKFAIKIKNLILKCGGINYQGGAEVENLSIFTYLPKIILAPNVGQNIKIKAVPNEDEEVIRQLLNGITIIPGCGEYIYDPDHSHARDSLVEMKRVFPNVKLIAPVVAWFADSLEIDKCHIKPGRDRNYYHFGKEWKVAGYTLESAHVISINEEESSVYGGSINDESIIKFLNLAKTMELNIIFYPLIMVDIPGKPWRGKIGAKPDDNQGKLSDPADIEAFFQNQYRPFILHYANLVKGLVEAFIIGSELVGLTSIHTTDNKFPFVIKLVELAYEVKKILGEKVKITYAADWSEYHTSDGIQRPLDNLWACEAIDFVSIDAYFPLTSTKSSRISLEEIKKGWHSGEGYDYYLDNNKEVAFKTDEPWTQWKNLFYWWYSEHWVWDSLKEQSIKTPWQPKSKPVWFTEFGFPSIDKASNKPNVFYDPKSTEGGVPTNSTGKVDNAIQLRALRATLEVWKDSEFVRQLVCWTWDARGVGWYKKSAEFADGNLWAYGHWLDGKLADRTIELSGHIEEVRTLSIKADNLSINTRISGQNFIAKIKDLVSIKDNCGPWESLSIKASNLHISPIHIKSRQFIADIENNLETYKTVTRKESHTYEGSKGETTISSEHISTPLIEAIYGEFNVRGSFTISPAVLNISWLFIEAGELNFGIEVTTHQIKKTFTGKKDWLTSKRQECTDIISTETAHVVEINADALIINIKENFSAVGSKINANSLDMKAKNYAFTGRQLEHFISKDGHGKGGLFSSGKSVHGYDRHLDIAGVRVVVEGQTYVIASGQIWLQASKITAQDLNISAAKVILEGLVGREYHGMSVSKKGVRLAFTCGSGEISGGIEAYKEQSTMQYYKEHLLPSVLLGRETLTINTGLLSQHGSIIGGGRGKIKADEWQVTAPRLVETMEVSGMQASVGARIGIKENISGTVKGLEGTIQEIKEFDPNNGFAAVNVASNIYSNFRALTNLASGNVISAGTWVTGQANTYSMRSSHVTHGMSLADFDSLEAEISGNISGSLEINARNQNITANHIELTRPEEETHSSQHQSGISLGTGGVSVSHYQEKDGKGFGGGTSQSFSGEEIFGPEIRVRYTSNDNKLDASYAHPDEEKVSKAWEGRIEGIIGRIGDNLQHQTSKVISFITDPSNILTDLSNEITKTIEAINPQRNIGAGDVPEDYEEEKDDEEASFIKKAKEELDKIKEYVYEEFDNICDKAKLAKENIIWASQNKKEAAKAIANWVIEHPEEALNIGINIINLATLIPQIKVFTAGYKLGSYKFGKTIIDEGQKLFFTPDEGFAEVDIEHSAMDRATIPTLTDTPSYKEIIENKTNVVKPELPETHQRYLQQLEYFENNQWSKAEQYFQKVPEEFGIPKLNKDGIGYRWEQVKCQDGTHNLRIDRGDIKAKHLTQHVDHVAISYKGRVVDNTGKNYIVSDDKLGVVYKVDRNLYDSGKTTIEYGFDVRKDIVKNKPGKHPDAHIPASEWYKWKEWHKPD